MKTNRTQGIKLIPVSVGGQTAQINLSSLDMNARAVHHGEFQGTKVNSAASLAFGDSQVIWPNANKTGVAVSIENAAFGVLATDFLTAQGFTVTPPAP
jgi:hypothetical protein